MAEDPLQRWTLTVGDRRHRVEVHGSVNRHVRWYVDDVLAGEKRTMEDRIRLPAGDEAEHGRVDVRFSGLGRPRRATLHPPTDAGAVATLAGAGGLDLDPEVGSPAAAYEDRVRAHPRRYAAIGTMAGVAKVVVPILLTLVAARLAFSIPWPDWSLPSLPALPLPDLPDLPALPLPDLPSIEVTVPEWLRRVLDYTRYVVPVLIAYVLARREIRRRRRQDELRAEQRRPADGTDQ